MLTEYQALCKDIGWHKHAWFIYNNLMKACVLSNNLNEANAGMIAKYKIHAMMSAGY